MSILGPDGQVDLMATLLAQTTEPAPTAPTTAPAPTTVLGPNGQEDVAATLLAQATPTAAPAPTAAWDPTPATAPTTVLTPEGQEDVAATLLARDAAATTSDQLAPFIADLKERFSGFTLFKGYTTALAGMTYAERFGEFRNFIQSNGRPTKESDKRKLQAIVASLYDTEENRAVTKEIEENMGFGDIRSSAFSDGQWTEEDYAKYDAFKTQFEWDKALDPDRLSGKSRGHINDAYEALDLSPGTGSEEATREGASKDVGATGRKTAGDINSNVPSRYKDIARQYQPTAVAAPLAGRSNTRGQVTDQPPAGSMRVDRGVATPSSVNPFGGPGAVRPQRGSAVSQETLDSGASSRVSAGGVSGGGRAGLDRLNTSKKAGLLTGVDPTSAKVGLDVQDKPAGLLG